MKLTRTIGYKIRKLRELRNYTQEYMAEQLKISQNAYSRIEREESDPSLTRINEICKILAVSLTDLLLFDEKQLLPNVAQHHSQPSATMAATVPQTQREKADFEKKLWHLQTHVSLLEKDVELLTKENNYLKEIISLLKKQ